MLYISIILISINIISTIISYLYMRKAIREEKRKSGRWEGLFYEQQALTNKCLDLIIKKYLP